MNIDNCEVKNTSQSVKDRENWGPPIRLVKENTLKNNNEPQTQRVRTQRKNNQKYIKTRDEILLLVVSY